MKSFRIPRAAWVVLGLLTAFRPDPCIAEVHPAQTLGELTDLVRRYYYEKTDPVKLYDGAIQGYLSALDPHTTYISPEELEKTQEKLQGSFEGIGIYFDIIERYLTVLSPIEGSPAYQVGLQPGDRIVKIDGRSSIGIKVSEVTAKLKGPKGSRVSVTVQREGWDDLLEFEIVRDKIEVPSVPNAFMLTPEIAYVRISRFSSHTGRELLDALKHLKQTGFEGLILDLRQNGGGYLEQAVEVSDQFIEKGRLLVYTEGRFANLREDHYAEEDPGVDPDIPILVLVNSYSASASEIVAGAIQDYDRGLVIGHTTFGKGLVQKQFRLKNGGAVLLTVARYYTPSDRPIQRPFSDDRDSYIEAARDDYDPNADPDSVAVKPIYHTRILHRKVYGNGGITPDITLRRDSLSLFERRLSRSYLFEFATRHAPDVLDAYSDFEVFVSNYKPGRRELHSFKNLLRARGFEFTDREFRSNLESIKRGIKQQISQVGWGRRAAGRLFARNDPEIAQTLSYFEDAEALLAARMHRTGRGRTHVSSPTTRGRPPIR